MPCLSSVKVSSPLCQAQADAASASCTPCTNVTLVTGHKKHLETTKCNQSFKELANICFSKALTSMMTSLFQAPFSSLDLVTFFVTLDLVTSTVFCTLNILCLTNLHAKNASLQLVLAHPWINDHFFLKELSLFQSQSQCHFLNRLYCCWSHSKNTKKKICLNSYTIKTDQGEQGSIIPKNDISIPLFYSKRSQKWRETKLLESEESRHSWTLNSFLSAEVNAWYGGKHFPHMNVAFLFP